MQLHYVYKKVHILILNYFITKKVLTIIWTFSESMITDHHNKYKTMKRSEIAVKITECNQKQSKQKLLGKWNQVAGSMQSFHNTQVCKKIYAMKWSATKQVMPVCVSGRNIKFKIKTELEFSSNIRISGKLLEME